MTKQKKYTGPVPEGAVKMTLQDLKEAHERGEYLHGPRGSNYRIRVGFVLWQVTGVLGRMHGNMLSVTPEHGGMGRALVFNHQPLDQTDCWIWTLDQQRAALKARA